MARRASPARLVVALGVAVGLGEGTAAVPVVYRGSVPDLFRSGRDISLRGELSNGTFVGKPGTLVTKCPSKYTDKKQT